MIRFDNVKFDGILGIGFSSKYKHSEMFLVFTNMVKLGLLSRPVFSFYLNRHVSFHIIAPFPKLFFTNDLSPHIRKFAFLYYKNIVFSYWKIYNLYRNPWKSKLNNELILGGSDKRLYKGKLTYINVIRETVWKLIIDQYVILF